MSVITRRVLSVPVRTSVNTWNVIVSLLTAPDQPARGSLNAIANTAEMLIAEEYTHDAPIVVMPATGDRIRIYTVHGSAAVEGDRADEARLATWPLAAAGWTLSLPCGVDDINDVQAALQPYSFVEVRDVTDGIATASSAAATTGPAAPAEPAARTGGGIFIDVDELERP